MVNARDFRLPPIILSEKAERAYSSLVANISMLAGSGVRVPCSFDPLMWDTDESRRGHDLVNRQYQKQVAKFATRQCKNNCQVLELCHVFKETGAIQSGILAGEWLGERYERKNASKKTPS